MHMPHLQRPNATGWLLLRSSSSPSPPPTHRRHLPRARLDPGDRNRVGAAAAAVQIRQRDDHGSLVPVVLIPHGLVHRPHAGHAHSVGVGGGGRGDRIREFRVCPPFAVDGLECVRADTRLRWCARGTAWLAGTPSAGLIRPHPPNSTHPSIRGLIRPAPPPHPPPHENAQQIYNVIGGSRLPDDIVHSPGRGSCRAAPVRV
jgi:hypothetical protein